MATYISELLTHFFSTIIITLILLGILGAIYHFTKKTDSTFTTFLNNNKVYLDIFLIVALSFMSITIAINANSIATTANQIAEKDLQIQKAANQPIFIFEKLTYSEGDYEKIVISNAGAPANNIHVKSITYASIEEGNFTSSKEFIFSIDYYNDRERVSAIENESNTIKLYELAYYPAHIGNIGGNRYLLSKFDSEFFDSLSNDKHTTPMQWKLCEYVRVQYEDIYGDSHDDLYYVSPSHPYKLQEEASQEVYDKLEEYPYYITMNKLNAEEIYQNYLVYAK